MGRNIRSSIVGSIGCSLQRQLCKIVKHDIVHGKGIF